MRGTISPGQKWDVMVYLFFYRESEEAKEAEEEEVVVAPDYGLPPADFGMCGLAADQLPAQIGDQWPAQIGDQWSADMVQAPISVTVGGAEGWDVVAAPAQIPGVPVDVTALLPQVGCERDSF
ncbi:40S ribosomal protein SA-like [Hibiscus syriacus]|uniref:40S ribosomal protein SA-like n=1 Tax=Hibiscus syriacus TaxID=106335 RepID=UPI00192227A1|nr:40S ribosomal protein SA-like [Hibiscus syriacus]